MQKREKREGGLKLQGVSKNAPVKQTTMAEHGRLVKVPKGSKMVNLDVFDNLGPFWAHPDTF